MAWWLVDSATSGRIGPKDLFFEALAGAFSKKSTAYLTLLGVAVGIATLVSTAGIAQSSGDALLARLAKVSGNVVTVTQPSEPQSLSAVGLLSFDREPAAARVTGVLEVGTYGLAQEQNQVVGLYLEDVSISHPVSAPVVGVSGRLDLAVEAQMRGRWFIDVELANAENIAIVGANVAESLHLGELPSTIFIGDAPFTVVGILDRVGHEPSLVSSVLIPHTTATARFGEVSVERVVALTKDGYAQDVARQIATALNPQKSSSLVVELPESFADVREYAEDNVNAIYYLLGSISLVVAALGIGNTMTMSVLERRAEIGLRVALGARRQDIYRQFILESSLIGFLGGLVGAGVGSMTVVVAALANGWPSATPGWVVFAGPMVGAILGCVAGLVPARSASGMQPADALRGGL